LFREPCFQLPLQVSLQQLVAAANSTSQLSERRRRPEASQVKEGKRLKTIRKEFNSLTDGYRKRATVKIFNFISFYLALTKRKEKNQQLRSSSKKERKIHQELSKERKIRSHSLRKGRICRNSQDQIKIQTVKEELESQKFYRLDSEDSQPRKNSLERRILSISRVTSTKDYLCTSLTNVSVKTPGQFSHFISHLNHLIERKAS